MGTSVMEPLPNILATPARLSRDEPLGKVEKSMPAFGSIDLEGALNVLYRLERSSEDKEPFEGNGGSTLMS